VSRRKKPKGHRTAAELQRGRCGFLMRSVGRVKAEEEPSKVWAAQRRRTPARFGILGPSQFGVKQSDHRLGESFSGRHQVSAVTHQVPSSMSQESGSRAYGDPASHLTRKSASCCCMKNLANEPSRHFPTF